jgi:hypothetical protein
MKAGEEKLFIVQGQASRSTPMSMSLYKIYILSTRSYRYKNGMALYTASYRLAVNELIPSESI